jgi:hypothetical protein
MSQPRLDDLISKLSKGHQKTIEFFSKLSPEQSQLLIYSKPDWNPRNLLAHFVSAEQHLLELAKNVVANGPGVPKGFDINHFNAEEQNRFEGLSFQPLQEELTQSRQRTIDWVRTLTDEQLDIKGRHPALGVISVEAMLTAIYGHQILHIRDITRSLRSKVILQDEHHASDSSMHKLD